MSWRKQENHKQETKAVKDALLGAGYMGVKVGHGKGTAWGWLHIAVQVPAPADCYCKHLDPNALPREFHCRKCSQAWSDTYDALCSLARTVTGRHGDYGGNINADITLIPKPEVAPIPIDPVMVPREITHFNGGWQLEECK